MVDSWPKPKPAAAVTIAILKVKFPGMYIRSEPPTSRPSQYIVVSLLNTDHPNPAFTVARPLIECWAESSAVAEDMCGDAVQALKNAKTKTFTGAQVKAFTNIHGPLDLNDPDIQDRRRWQFHGDLYLSTR